MSGLVHRAGLALVGVVALGGAPLWALAHGSVEGAGTRFEVYRADSPAAPPVVRSVVATVSDHLCRRPWDAEATENEGLEIIKARAKGLGANGLINVRFDRHRTELKSMCWQKLTVTGTAVVFSGS
jgi:uncharacterized protein YbjQ (UPF0145 family)